LNAKLAEFLQLEGAVHKVLRTHPHPNILQPVNIINGVELSAVVFPSVGDDLHTYVRARKGLPEREARPIFRSILSAVNHCHTHRIVFRDLRLGKIFFKGHSRTDVTVGDMDGAQVVSHSSPFLTDRKGSPAFVSPEVVMSQSYDGAAADMWALGVILYIMLTGTYPFQDSHPASLFHKIQQGHSAVFFPTSMSEGARDIIRSLLVKEPHLRLTAAELMSDLWFRDFIPSEQQVISNRTCLEAASLLRLSPEDFTRNKRASTSNDCDLQSKRSRESCQFFNQTESLSSQ
jgi:carbon catabolite-derepressing protein kinase